MSKIYNIQFLLFVRDKVMLIIDTKFAKIYIYLTN